MTRKLLWWLLLPLLNSCITQERCSERFPNAPFSIDSTYTKDSLVPTTFTVTIPGQEVQIHDTIPCPEVEYHAEVKKNNITARVEISKGKLKVECIADSLKEVIGGLNRIIMTYRSEKSKIVEKPSYDHQATDWDKFCYYWFASTLFVFIVWAYFKFKLT